MDPVVIESNRTLKGVFADLWDYRELFLFLGMARSIGSLQADRHRPGVGCDHAPAHDGDSHPGVRPPGQTSSGGVPYPVLVFAGLLPWQFFSSVLSQSSASLVNNRNMVSKVYFPRIIIPSTQVVVSLTDLVISLAILAGLMSLYGIAPSLCLLFLPLLIGLAILRSLGVGYWISALNVKYRDFRYIVPLMVQFGLYISPVGFSSDVVPESWRLLYSLNPMVGVIDGFRWAILGGPSELYVSGLVCSVLLAVALFASGLVFFLKAERKFADVI